jgi:DnaJ-class molecular chaperone
MAIKIVCMICNGLGKVNGEICKNCGGKSTTMVDEIPEGYRKHVVDLHNVDIDKRLVMCLTTGKL